MLPSFIWTVVPWGSSTVTSMRCRRRSRPQMMPREAPLLRRTRARRPGPASRHPLLLDLGARRAIAADPGEVAAGRREALRVLDGHLEARHLRLESADLLQVLVLAERGLDGAPDGRHVLARGEEEG